MRLNFLSVGGAWVLYGCAAGEEVKKDYWITAETLSIQ